MSSKKITPQNQKHTIIHECGHMLILWHSPNIIFSDCYVRAYTKRTKNSLGETDHSNSFDTDTETIECLIDQIAFSYGGYFAERAYNIPVDSGSSDDFKVAKMIAKRMVLKHGMAEITHLEYFNRKNPVPGYMGKKVHKAMQDFLQKGQERTKKILKEKAEDLDKLILALYNKRPKYNKKELRIKEIEQILGPRPPLPTQNIRWPEDPKPAITTNPKTKPKK
jgi:ATP-dependent Zn protease